MSAFKLSVPWRVTWFLFFAAALNYADRAALSSVIIPLRGELGVTDAQVGLMGMLFLWSYALVSPFAGNIADRFSRSKIVIWSLITWSAITVFTGFSTSVTMLIVLRVALGLAESFYLPAAASLLGDHHGSATLGKAMGLHMTGLKIGVMAGGVTAGFVAQHFGWRTGFWLLGGLGIMLAFLAPRYLADRELPKAKPTGNATAATQGRFWEACRYLARVPSFYAMLVCTMATGVANWIFFTWLPVYFGETHHMNLAAAGLIGVGLFKLPNFIGVAFGGWLSDIAAKRDPRNRALIKSLGFLLSGPVLFFFYLNPSFAVVATLLCLATLIRSLGAPNEHPIVCDVVPTQYRSTAFGILNAFATAAGGMGVFLSGIFKAELGLNTIFSISSFFFILAGAVTLFSYRFNILSDMARAKDAEVRR